MKPEEDFRALYGPYFTYDEFRCQCSVCESTAWFTTPEFRSFMALLMRMRVELAFPFIVNSGYRCPEYNDEIYVRAGSAPGEHLDGPHTKGAADVKVSFERAYKLNRMASKLGMGVGIKQHGDVAKRFIHVDNGGARLWSY